MTDTQLKTLAALSQDLLRVAMGRYRNQIKMSERFTHEAKARLNEISDFALRGAIMASLNSTHERSAEDLLMYSTLVKNIVLSAELS
ncbi:MAG: hypothetical protein Fur0011_6960 [Candidatus Microgenomates bacterium]